MSNNSNVGGITKVNGCDQYILENNLLKVHVVLIHLSDETGVNKKSYDHPNVFHIFRNYYHPKIHAQYRDKITYLPLGYSKGYYFSENRSIEYPHRNEIEILPPAVS